MMNTTSNLEQEHIEDDILENHKIEYIKPKSQRSSLNHIFGEDINNEDNETKFKSSSLISNDSFTYNLELAELIEEYNTRNIVPLEEEKCEDDNDEYYISSEDESTNKDLEENKLLSLNLKEESKFGKLNIVDKKKLNMLKKMENSILFKDNKPPKVERFHDDLFFSEARANINEPKVNRYQDTEKDIESKENDT